MVYSCMIIFKNEKDDKNLQRDVSKLHLAVGKGDTVKDNDLGQPLNIFNRNMLVWELGKVNPAIMYRNKLGLEKQTITQRWERSFISRGPSIKVEVQVKERDKKVKYVHH